MASIDHLTKEMIRSMSIDFVVNEMSKPELCGKYKLSNTTVCTIIDKMQLVKRRDQYKTLVLEKSLDKCAEHQAEIISKATKILNKHVAAMERKMAAKDAEPMDPKDVNSLINVLNSISNEKRLDSGQSTENVAHRIEVTFTGGITPILNRDKKPQDIPTDAKVIDPEEQKIIDKSPAKSAEKDIAVEIDNDILKIL